MITEISRKAFLELDINTMSPPRSWLAICLFILPEWLRKLNLSGADKARVTNVSNYGREILSDLDNGFFARIAWSTYFAIVQYDMTVINKHLEDKIIGLRSREDYCRLWRYSIVEVVNQNLYEVFYELEGSSYDKARQETES